jgi:hypothetical protein
LDAVPVPLEVDVPLKLLPPPGGGAVVVPAAERMPPTAPGAAEIAAGPPTPAGGVALPVPVFALVPPSVVTRTEVPPLLPPPKVNPLISLREVSAVIERNMTRPAANIAAAAPTPKKYSCLGLKAPTASWRSGFSL